MKEIKNFLGSAWDFATEHYILSSIVLGIVIIWIGINRFIAYFEKKNSPNQNNSVVNSTNHTNQAKNRGFFKKIFHVVFHAIKVYFIGMAEDFKLIMKIKQKIREAIKKHGYKSAELGEMVREYHYALTQFSMHLAFILIATAWPLNYFLAQKLPYYFVWHGIKFNVALTIAYEIELTLGLGLIAYWIWSKVGCQKEISKGHTGLLMAAGIIVDYRDAGDGVITTTPIVKFIDLVEVPKELRVEFELKNLPIISSSSINSSNKKVSKYKNDPLHTGRTEITKAKAVAIFEIHDAITFFRNKLSVEDVKINLLHMLSSAMHASLTKLSYAESNDNNDTLEYWTLSSLEEKLFTYDSLNDNVCKSCIRIKNVEIYDFDFGSLILHEGSKIPKVEKRGHIAA